MLKEPVTNQTIQLEGVVKRCAVMAIVLALVLGTASAQTGADPVSSM